MKDAIAFARSALPFVVGFVVAAGIAACSVSFRGETNVVDKPAKSMLRCSTCVDAPTPRYTTPPPSYVPGACSSTGNGLSCPPRSLYERHPPHMPYRDAYGPGERG